MNYSPIDYSLCSKREKLQEERSESFSTYNFVRERLYVLEGRKMTIPSVNFVVLEFQKVSQKKIQVLIIIKSI